MTPGILWHPPRPDPLRLLASFLFHERASEMATTEAFRMFHLGAAEAYADALVQLERSI